MLSKAREIFSFVAVVGCLASTATAQNSNVEIHVLFGSPSRNALPDSSTNLSNDVVTTNPSVHAEPGDVVYLPIFLRAFVGNSPTGDTRISGCFFEGWSQTTQDQSFAYDDAFLANLGYPVQFGPGLGDGVVNPGGPLANQVPADLTRMFKFMGGLTVFPEQAMHAGNTYYLGYYAIKISGAASVGDTMNLWLSTPAGAVTPNSTNDRFTVFGGLGATTTVAFGARPNGDMDEDVYSTSNDSAGTLPNHFSTTPDATITVGPEIVPEPASFALLAGGLLMLRRARRA